MINIHTKRHSSDTFGPLISASVSAVPSALPLPLFPMCIKSNIKCNSVVIPVSGQNVFISKRADPFLFIYSFFHFPIHSRFSLCLYPATIQSEWSRHVTTTLIYYFPNSLSINYIFSSHFLSRNIRIMGMKNGMNYLLLLLFLIQTEGSLVTIGTSIGWKFSIKNFNSPSFRCISYAHPGFIFSKTVYLSKTAFCKWPWNEKTSQTVVCHSHTTSILHSHSLIFLTSSSFFPLFTLKALFITRGLSHDDARKLINYNIPLFSSILSSSFSVISECYFPGIKLLLKMESSDPEGSKNASNEDRGLSSSSFSSITPTFKKEAKTGSITRFQDADHDSLDETFIPSSKQQQSSSRHHPIKFTSANFDNSESDDEEGVRLRSESVSKSPSDLSKVASRTVFFHSVTSAGEKKIVTRKFTLLHIPFHAWFFHSFLLFLLNVSVSPKPNYYCTFMNWMEEWGTKKGWVIYHLLWRFPIKFFSFLVFCILILLFISQPDVIIEEISFRFFIPFILFVRMNTRN